VPGQQPVRVVAIGVSAGGPPVLEAILCRLPAGFPAPILIVQHIAEGFVGGLVECLQRTTALRVRLAEADLAVRAGEVYIAPDGVHLGIDAEGRLRLDAAPAERSQRPAVSYLFRSIAAAFGGRAAAVLLTGMGCDGAAELKVLRDLRAVTIAQDQRSSTVFGMPGEAIKLGAAQYVMSPDEIGDALCRICGVPSATGRERTRGGDRPGSRS
jgi:two-component system chemotaxis response regulator CheB